MSRPTRMTRRALLQSVAAMAPLSLAGCATTAVPAGNLRLRQADPVARSLHYMEDTRDVDSSHPLAANHSPEQRCANCVHGRGESSPGWRSCPVFPGRVVAEDGWCSVWARGPSAG